VIFPTQANRFVPSLAGFRDNRDDFAGLAHHGILAQTGLA